MRQGLQELGITLSLHEHTVEHFLFFFPNNIFTPFSLCVSQTQPLMAHEKVQSGSQTAVGWEQTVLIVCNGETELLPAIKGG